MSLALIPMHTPKKQKWVFSYFMNFQEFWVLKKNKLFWSLLLAIKHQVWESNYKSEQCPGVLWVPSKVWPALVLWLGLDTYGLHPGESTWVPGSLVPQLSGSGNLTKYLEEIARTWTKHREGGWQKEQDTKTLGGIKARHVPRALGKSSWLRKLTGSKQATATSQCIKIDNLGQWPHSTEVLGAPSLSW